MTSTTSKEKENVSDRRWLDRDFLKEKLRIRERYWHYNDDNISLLLSSAKLPSLALSLSSTLSCSWIIPDGRAWRTYLPLIDRLVQDEEDDTGEKSPTAPSTFFPWVLLESQVDVMDHNTVSTRTATTNKRKNQFLLGQAGRDEVDNTYSDSNDHPLVLPPEKASPQERSKLQRLILQGQQNKNNKLNKTVVVPFCDFSIRVQDDEWDILHYENMNVEERSKHALLRAGRLLLSSSDNCDRNSISSEEVLVLSGYTSNSDEFQRLKQFTDEDEGNDDNENEGKEMIIRVVTIDDLLEQWFKASGAKALIKLDHTKQLARRCEEEYAKRNDPSLATKSSLEDSEGVINRQQSEYWTEEELRYGLQNKTLFRGRLVVSKENPKEGFVEVPSDDDGPTSTIQYFINNVTPRYQHFNRAFHQDVVVIQPLPESEWTRPVGRRRLVHIREDDSGAADDTDDDIGNNDEVDVMAVPSARVVGIIKESRRQYVATIVDDPVNNNYRSDSVFLAVPMNVLIPKIRIRTSGGWQRYMGYRLWVQIDDWEVGSMYPSGYVVERIGKVGELETEITCLLKENQIQLEPFSAAAMAMLPVEGHNWTIPKTELEQRRDLRSTYRIFSVDPVGCQDIDDTMHARVLPNGDYEIGVHIADVTYWMNADSPLDLEAQRRGTTFYLVDRRFDMLPSLLSSDLCSLHGDMDRLAVSTIWTFSNDLKEVKDFWYGRTVIHNCQAMTYEQALNILQDLPPDGDTDLKKTVPPLTAGYPVKAENVAPLKEDLLILTKLARILRKQREEVGGAVDLSSGDQGNELKFTLDENNNPIKVTPKKQQEIHHTIAELMILANTWVARTIVDRFPQSALLRIHRSVDESRFQDLKEILHAGHISFDGRSNMKLAESLKKAESKSNSPVTALFQSLATRAMSEAQYVSTGQKKGESGLSHYGLGLKKYTHFTSPIRRYADVVVHRQLLLSLTPKERNIVAPPPGFGAKALESLPGSETISIMRGEGLLHSNEQEKAPRVQYQSDSSRPRPVSPDESRELDVVPQSELYTNVTVARICETLNRQNRMAKLSSYECQSLFLSLYFKDHFETTQAVVTNLRSNGFWAYIPRFDFRGPVYLSDKNGLLQVDPALLKLQPSAGMDPTAGFASSGTARRFPTGKCCLVQSTGEEHLVVTVSETKTKLEIRVLDVVHVSIFCDDWTTKARVPLPKIHLIASSSKSRTSSYTRSSRQPIESLAESQSLIRQSPAIADVHDIENNIGVPSVYNDILNIETPPILDEKYGFEEPKDKQEATSTSGRSLMPGRLVFGGFVNPDTRSAQQSKAIEDASTAALERRNEAMNRHEIQNTYDTVRRIEKDITARQQRLAANKRSTRKAKGQ